MANYQVVDADQLDENLTSVADAIREKGGTSEDLEFHDEFAAAILAIETGGTEGGCEIVQTLGDSEDKVISQKTTTAYLTDHAERIGNIEKTTTADLTDHEGRIQDIEKKLDFSAFETDDSVAYTKDVPSDAFPFASVDMIGGMTIKDGNALKSAKVTEVESVGANLFDDIGWFTHYNFTPQSDGSWRGSSFLAPCFTNTNRRSGSIYITVIARTDSETAPLAFTAYYTDGTNKSLYRLPKTSAFETTTIASDPDKIVDYIRWGYGEGSNYYVKGVSISFVNTMEYIPYSGHTYPVPEAVKALDGYGAGLNESVYNYVDFDNKQFVKRVEAVDMATLSWYYPSATQFYSVSTSVADKIRIDYNNPPMLSEDYDIVGWSGAEKLVNVITMNSQGYIRVYTETQNEKPTGMLYYELAEPIVTDISDILPDGNYIEVEGGGTVTMVNEHQMDVPSEITYQVKRVMA